MILLKCPTIDKDATVFPLNTMPPSSYVLYRDENISDPKIIFLSPQ